MGRLLNNLFYCFLFISAFSLAQSGTSKVPEYHNKEQFKKFKKRANTVAAWQIQNLRFGALVVRLQNNQRKVDALKKAGQIDLANEVIASTQFYNKLMMRVYTKELKFCKVYFIYAQLSDSLLNGARTGIFLDSTLNVNPAINMTQNFYVIAEKDYVYNSSIGFVREDTARYVKETGNRTIDVAVVLKNKYGHQLKQPFPVFVKRAFLKSSSVYEAKETIQVSPNVFKEFSFLISKDVTFEKQSAYVMQLNTDLNLFYNKSQGTQINDPAIKPFLY